MTSQANNRPVDTEFIKQAILFCLMSAGFYFIDQTAWFDRHVLGHLAEGTAWATHVLLSLAGVPTVLTGSTIATATAYFEVAGSCAGSMVIFLYAAAALAFLPAWTIRLYGLVSGIGLIFCLNILRSSMIVLASSRITDSLWFWHTLAGQALIITGALGLFLYWAGWGKRGTGPAMAAPRRRLIEILVLFCAGFILSSLAYRLFGESDLGAWFHQVIVNHAAWLLSFVAETSAKDLTLRVASLSIELNQKCLSGPVVIIVMAAIFAWPARWRFKWVWLVVGFFGVYYAHFLSRTVVIALSFHHTGTDQGIFRHFFGTCVLMAGLLALVTYKRCSLSCVTSYRRQIPRLLLAGVAACGVAWLSRWVTLHTVIPLLMSRINGTASLTYDPYSCVSRMVEFHTFFWLTLWWSSPRFSWRDKIWGSLIGMFLIFTHFAALIALTEIWHLTPPVWLLKSLMVALPFSALVLMEWPAGRMGRIEPTSVRLKHTGTLRLLHRRPLRHQSTPRRPIRRRRIRPIRHRRQPYTP
ncbi:MAG: archaeosortase/exosortase family protein [Deltaproteobacteria bacterium]|nr:archaeosortase/exosortase family protein [Deltaproteobacteria bacterium]